MYARGLSLGVPICVCVCIGLQLCRVVFRFREFMLDLKYV